MAPAVTIDNTPDLDLDFTPSTTATAPKIPSNASTPRTLLLAPPSVAAHPQALTQLAAAYDRSATDIQMLDRLALGLVHLPAATYDSVLLLSPVTDNSSSNNANGNISASAELPPLGREVIERIAPALRPGGLLRAQTGSLPAADQTEAILAGLVRGAEEGVMAKPAAGGGQQTVTLKFGARKKAAATATATAAAAPAAAAAPETVAVNTAKRKVEGLSTPAGVGFVDGDAVTGGGDEDMYEDGDEDEFPSEEELRSAARIDPDSLLSAEDRLKPVNIPEACKPNSKRRRACKDCTCGLAERLEAEDKAKRAAADAGLAKLNAADLTEVDFTVQGKVGSCGNCALGDAFRCDGCPYIGLPAFKPGEEVRLLNNDIQL